MTPTEFLFSRMFLFAGPLAGVAAGVILVVWLVLGPRRTQADPSTPNDSDAPRHPRRGPLWAGAIALPAAVAVGDYAARSWVDMHPWWWPANATDRVVHGSVIALLTGLAVAMWPARWRVGRVPLGWVRWVLAAVGFMGTAYVFTDFRLANGYDEPGVYWAALAGFGVVLAVVAGLLHLGLKRGPGWIAPAQLAIGLGAAQLVFLLSGSETIGRQAISLSAGMAAATGVGLLCLVASRRFTIAGGTAVAALALYGSMTVQAWALGGLAERPWYIVALLAIAPLGLLPAHVGPIARKAWWMRLGVGLVGIAIPMGAAVWIAWANKPDYDYF